MSLQTQYDIKKYTTAETKTAIAVQQKKKNVIM